MRTYKINRDTLETKISVEINLDGSGKSEIDTGIGFFDHMLTLMAFHGKFDINIKCEGDTYVDDHHTIEDIGIALGQCVKNALGNRRGIKRYAGALASVMEKGEKPVAICHGLFLCVKSRESGV